MWYELVARRGDGAAEPSGGEANRIRRRPGGYHADEESQCELSKCGAAVGAQDRFHSTYLQGTRITSIRPMSPAARRHASAVGRVVNRKTYYGTIRRPTSPPNSSETCGRFGGTAH